MFPILKTTIPLHLPSEYSKIVDGDLPPELEVAIEFYKSESSVFSMEY